MARRLPGISDPGSLSRTSGDGFPRPAHGRYPATPGDGNREYPGPIQPDARMSEHKKSPLTAEEQQSPEPERMVTPAEEAGQELQELDDPPQAEGPRDRSDDEQS